ncbi:hypothetical protein [Daejeonella lutea]|uniref:Uncharacterized protein n=1 Tax=Daejeonella lutea TaxID=572036 RepID=A0A1T5D1E1_9SPHI|nr:hypothetical protein [Daejeonella lutea]SKB65416.1 hypothetical protein SAMN05661099_2101 [Daejeonella lutea]
MAIQTSPLFAGFRGSVNRQLLFRQCGGRTVVSSFPDRSKVIYSERQKHAQKRFSEAIAFARVVIKEPGLKDIYSVKASLLGFRSAWNLAIAEFMSAEPLGVKKKKIRFDRSIITNSLGWKVPVKLYKLDEEAVKVVLKVPERLKTTFLRDHVQFIRLRESVRGKPHLVPV